ncbi:endonuclease/exonuclease/phosphatase family protein [Nocardia sp. A7]|uniref:endonuclease/exonuclease/phosphatase family protein n=1 Tax=Nocardia sp. A7 TaxID=2789274 RepID=UPI00397DDB75
MSQSGVRVLTWNVQHASASRAGRQVSWLTRVDADAIVLTEVSAGAAGDVTARQLRDAGYRVHLPDPGDDRYRVLLAARGVLDPVQVDIAVSPHRFPLARVKQASGFEFALTGVYVPSRGSAPFRNVAKRAFQHSVTTCLPGLAKTLPSLPVIVAGDLNVVEPGHIPHYSVFGAWEYDFYRSFAEAGFVDAFRLKHPDLIDHSWLGRPSADGTRNGYRFDHAFVSAAHRNMVHECRYQHRPRNNELSDHSAMILTLAS